MVPSPYDKADVAVERFEFGADIPVSDESARTVNMLREVALSLNSEQHSQAATFLEALGPEATEQYPSSGQLTGVALEVLDAWYARNELQRGMARVQHSEISGPIGSITPALEALARKGRAARSSASLLKRNPEQEVAAAGAHMVAATVAALARYRDESFETVLDELLPAQPGGAPILPAVPSADPAVKEPATQAPAATEAPKASETPPDDPKARYTAIVETRFMAGVKEFQQWMGDAHPVTGTGLPKRADIQAVAATVGIDAEGVAKKQEPDEAPASDSDLSVPAQPQPTRYVQSAQAIPELMAFLDALQEFKLIDIVSTKVQPGERAQEFGFEDFDQLDAAEELVATYVRQTLSHATEDDAAARAAQHLVDGSTEVNPALIPRLRQLESMDLVEIRDGAVVMNEPLRPAVMQGAQQLAQHTA